MGVQHGACETLKEARLIPIDAEMAQLHFFFQAEDGIRDIGVTGVQTCALPISNTASCGNRSAMRSNHARGSTGVPRSEERRVGKEWRCPRMAHASTATLRWCPLPGDG